MRRRLHVTEKLGASKIKVIFEIDVAHKHDMRSNKKSWTGRTGQMQTDTAESARRREDEVDESGMTCSDLFRTAPNTCQPFLGHGHMSEGWFEAWLDNNWKYM